VLLAEIVTADFGDFGKVLMADFASRHGLQEALSAAVLLPFGRTDVLAGDFLVAGGAGGHSPQVTVTT
jgi:hypothetical protein